MGSATGLNGEVAYLVALVLVLYTVSFSIKKNSNVRVILILKSKLFLFGLIL